MKPLSNNNILNALLFPVLLIPVLILPTFVGIHIPLVSQSMAVIVLWSILGLWIFLAATGTYDLRYDDKFIYLYSYKGRIKLPLTVIKKIYQTNDRMKVVGLSSWAYILEFDPRTKIGDQIIYEVVREQKVAEFINVVKLVNPSVLVKLG